MPGQGGSSSWVEQQNFDQIQTQINELQISVNNLSYQVGRILSALNRGTTPTALTIDVANQEIIAKDGTLIVSGIATVTSNYNLRIPLIWQDATGVALPPASGNTQASSSNLKVVPEVDVADDDMSIVVRVAALGSSFVTVGNGGITNVIQVRTSRKSLLEIIYPDAPCLRANVRIWTKAVLRDNFQRIAEQAVATPWVPRNPRPIEGPDQVREIMELAS